jgi:uncharacterized protein YndB with AHSA1/START domain
MPLKSHEADVAGREMRASRVFDAPRALVFQMWTDPAHVGKWWGPRGFTTTTSAIDIRPGGTWRFVMHGPDGTDYPNEILYVAVDAPERIVYEHVGPPHHRSTITFEDEGTRTRVSVHMVFDSAQELEAVVNVHKADAGLQQHLESLADELAAEQSPYLLINRVFNAPRETVFAMWTQPEHFAKWWGPHGYTTPTVKIDLRKGGTSLVCMRSPEGKDGWFGGVYEEVAPPERLVLRTYFCDEKGNRISNTDAGFPPDFPSELLMTVTFADTGDGQTKMTLVQTMPKHMLDGGAFVGWNQSFEKLDAVLAASPRPAST